MATSTLRAPERRPVAAPPPRTPGLLGSAALAAAAAAGVVLTGLLVVALLAWALAPGGSGPSAPARVAVWAWLAGLHVPLHVRAGGGFAFGLAPLGVGLLAGVALWHAGRWAARRSAVTTAPRAVEAALALGASYAACCGLGAGITAGAARPDPLAALVLGWLVGTLAGGLGAASAAGVLHPALHRLPAPVLVLARATAGASLALVAGGALLVAASLLAHAGRVAALAGQGGAPVLLLVAVGYAPTAAVWAGAYSLGPGFAVGAGTVVGPFGVHLGAVPALPLLGALPGDATGTTAGAWALVLPLAACAVGGWLVGARTTGPATAARRAAALAPVLAVVAAVACWLSGGAAGPGRLAVTGPSPWQVGLALAVVALLAAPGAAYEASRRHRR